MNKRVSLPLILVFLIAACQPAKSPGEIGIDDADLIHKSVHRVTQVMVHDIFSPPVASRVYAYTSIAAYEAIAVNRPDLKSLAGQINEFTEAPKAESELVSLELASLHAFYKVGEELLFSTDMLTEFQDSIYSDFRKKGLSKKVMDASIEYGEVVAAHVLNYAAGDNYKETRGTQKFTVTDEPGRWIPTPPAYMDAIEPSWMTIRPFVMQSADQFKPVPPVPYSMEEGSDFYNEVMAVYDYVNNLDEEQAEIAKFWDCNPFATQVKGHFMFAVKKITPGGHWMGIAGIASKSENLSYAESAQVYAMTSIALFDGFISSWDEKFRSNLIRPETVINKYIDPDWKPLLQTPPFPEYTSGHSLISRAAAEVLTDLFGDEFYFEDTTEVEYGLPVRTFDSFFEASDEAAVSRLYGGIHYPMAAEHGITQGQGVGLLVVENINLVDDGLADNR